jgi:hypothetical protein
MKKSQIIIAAALMLATTQTAFAGNLAITSTILDNVRMTCKLLDPGAENVVNSILYGATEVIITKNNKEAWIQYDENYITTQRANSSYERILSIEEHLESGSGTDKGAISFHVGLDFPGTTPILKYAFHLLLPENILSLGNDQPAKFSCQ